MKKCFAFLVVLSLLVVAAGTASAAILKNGVYFIRMSNSRLTVAATSSARGSQLVLWRDQSTPPWEFRHIGNDIYEIRIRSYVMDLSGNKRKNGTPVIIWSPHGGKNQQWKVQRAGRYYRLINVGTGLALDLDHNNRRPGARLQGYERNRTDAQLFDIVPASGSRNIF